MYKNKNFFFRIDSNKKIGLGHLARCLILAKILKKNCFFIVDSNNKLFNKLNFKFISLYNDEKYKNEISDAKKVNSIIKKFNNVNLIVDDYRIGLKWHEYFKKRNVKIIVIDDLVDRKFDTDVYLNFKLDNSKEFRKKLERFVSQSSK